jgi:small-conductance mechanosensitive channel
MIDDVMFREALASLVERVVVFTPTVILALVLLAAGWLGGRLAASLVRRLLRLIGLESLVESSGLKARLDQANVAISLSEILGRLVFWIVFLVFAILSFQRLGIDFSVLPVDRVLTYLPRLLGAILLLIFGALVAQWGGKAVQTAAAGLGVRHHKSLGAAARGLLLVMMVILTVEQLGFDVSILSTTIVNLITLVAAGFIFTFALGGREVARNALSGFYLRENLNMGDRIRIGDIAGTLEAIGTLGSEIETADGKVIVPNSKLLESTVLVESVEESEAS